MMNLYVRAFFSITFLVTVHFLSAQQIRFNEVSSSNSRFFDEDGDSPDWFELHNTGTNSVSLDGWTVSDKQSKPKKWTFPNVSIEPDGYLLVWASGKDRLEFGVTRTLISQGDLFKYFIPASALDPAWTSIGFDDGGWTEGTTGFGYSDGDDSTEVPQGTLSVFMRKKFTIADANQLQELILHVDYDDGFVAYINGTEVARANINGNPPAFDALTPTDHEANIHQNGQPDRFELEVPTSLLQNGENVLSIQAHNTSTTSSDLTLIPFLSATYKSSTHEGITPPPVLQLSNLSMHTNFKISADGETLYLYDSNENPIDNLKAENIPADLSFGLNLSENELLFFEAPTPGLPNTTQGYAGIINTKVVFSHPGGRIQTLSLTLSGNSTDELIRYTLDATVPNDTSPIYTEPLNISQNTVVRARIFRASFIPSPTQSRTYLTSASHDLPIITLVTEPDNFFHPDNGMYIMGNNASPDFPHFGSNFWEDWERPMNVGYYEPDGTLGINFDGGVKIFGGWSRGNAQRSMSFFARKQYGVDAINYRLFPDKSYDVFQSFVLRNSGNDWLNTMLRDGTLTGLMQGTDLEFHAFRPTVTYINGEYWGFYNMREKTSEHFLASRHNVSPDSIDILETWGNIVHGDNQEYVALTGYLNSNSLVSDANYQVVAQQVDIDNFIMYYLAQIYFNNTDWPGNNIKFWKYKGGKWRWILYDTDFGFGIWNPDDFANNTLAFALESNGQGWPNPSWSTLMFRKLMENTGFRNKFINQFADELNSRFLPNKVSTHIDSFAAIVASEVKNHYSRWGADVNRWNRQVSGMRTFGNRRHTSVKIHITNQFDLEAYRTITIDNETPEKGYVRINSLTIREDNWSGDYFQGVPIKVSAIPEPGYTFSHWSGDYGSSKVELNIDLHEAISLTPNFEKAAIPTTKPLIINEINYNSSPDHDTDDWIELYNPHSDFVDLSDWVLKDDLDDHGYIFPNGTLIASEGYLVVASNLSKFRSFYPNLENVIGNIGFGFSSKGDAIRLFDKFGIINDSVAYSVSEPWPTTALATGPSIELMNPSLDNMLPENWAVLHEFGSPGRTNIDKDTIVIISPNNIDDLSHYPNPFQDRINVTFTLRDASHITAKLIDNNGRLVHVFIDKKMEPGDHHLVGDFGFLANGMYILEFTDDQGYTYSSKWMKISE